MVIRPTGDLLRYHAPNRAIDMGILSDFFVADEDGASEYNGEGFAPEDVCQAKGITSLEAAGMLAVLRGGGDPVTIMDEFELVTPQEANAWTMSVPQDMVDALAALEEAAVPTISREFARATAEELGWSQADFEPLVNDLRALAKRAREQGTRMYLWNCI